MQRYRLIGCWEQPPACARGRDASALIKSSKVEILEGLDECPVLIAKPRPRSDFSARGPCLTRVAAGLMYAPSLPLSFPGPTLLISRL